MTANRINKALWCRWGGLATLALSSRPNERWWRALNAVFAPPFPWPLFKPMRGVYYLRQIVPGPECLHWRIRAYQRSVRRHHSNEYFTFPFAREDAARGAAWQRGEWARVGWAGPLHSRSVTSPHVCVCVCVCACSNRWCCYRRRSAAFTVSQICCHHKIRLFLLWKYALIYLPIHHTDSHRKCRTGLQLR